MAKKVVNTTQAVEATETVEVIEAATPAVEATTPATPAEKLSICSRHGAPYRRCGFVFDAEPRVIDVAPLSTVVRHRLTHDPHLLVEVVNA